MYDRSTDARVRSTAFGWLADQQAQHGDVLPRSALQEGFHLDGQRIPLLGPQGIFKPAILDVPLSLTTAPHGPYDDAFDSDNLLRYQYRGTDPEHRDNAGVRFAMEQRLPLVYFHGVVPGKYVAAWPVFVVADSRRDLTFTVAVDDAQHMGLDVAAASQVSDEADFGRRQYITTLVRQRLHQRGFRERVMAAYRSQCAFCRFRHIEMLDAAHIIPDSRPHGDPVVENGLALCKFHHAAFDHGLLGLRPDYILEARPDLLKEVDGPSLEHGIQRLHNQRIALPRRQDQWPSPDRLEERFVWFRERIQAA